MSDKDQLDIEVWKENYHRPDYNDRLSLALKDVLDKKGYELVDWTAKNQFLEEYGVKEENNSEHNNQPCYHLVVFYSPKEYGVFPTRKQEIFTEYRTLSEEALEEIGSQLEQKLDETNKIHQMNKENPKLVNWT